MGKIERCKLWLQAHDDLFMDLVRVYIGAGLFVKAFYLLHHREYLTQVIGDSGNMWFAPAAVAQYVIIAHMIGGVLLAFGLLTRLAALAQLPILAGAVFYVYLPHMTTVEPRQSLEYSALVAFLLACQVVFGAGRWSLDYVLSRKREPAEAVVVPEAS